MNVTGLLKLFKPNPLKEELKRVKNAISYMMKWDDIPLSWQMPTLCEILGIKNNETAKSFCIDLLIKDPKVVAESLLKIRTHGPNPK